MVSLMQFTVSWSFALSQCQESLLLGEIVLLLYQYSMTVLNIKKDVDFAVNASMFAATWGF